MNFNHRRGRASLACQGARSVAAAALGLAPGCPHQNDGGGSVISSLVLCASSGQEPLLSQTVAASHSHPCQ